MGLLSRPILFVGVPIYVKGRHWGGFRVGYRPRTLAK